MASFSEHILQAKKNLGFVLLVNEKIQENWEWQITPAFYVAVHLINAHLAQEADQHYRSHREVRDAINPYGQNYPCMMPEDIYLSYRKLEGLSRRARYLCHEDNSVRETHAFLTHDKHFKKAICYLDAILFFFDGKYKIDFGQPVVSCVELNNRTPLKVFAVK